MSSAAIAALVARWNVVQCPSNADWRAARHRYLTASDVAAVLGLHPHKSRNKVLADKRGPADTGPERRVKAMRGGQFLESGVFEWYLDDLRYAAEQSGLPLPEGEVLRNEQGTSLLVAHPDPMLRLAASPDGLVVEGPCAWLAEIKVHGPRQWALWYELPGPKARARAEELGILSTSEPKCPLQHWVQLQVQLLCTGVKAGVVVGNCGSERNDAPFDADAAFQARVVEATRAFWAEV